jgi:serine protease Do
VAGHPSVIEMQIFRALPLALALAACGGPATDPSTPASERDPNIVSVSASVPTLSSVADLVEHLSPTVVSITTVTSGGRATPFDFFAPDSPRQRQGAGTGFVIDGAGLVITNAHVVADADEVMVQLYDDRQFSARVVGRDVKLDLALLKIDGVTGLPAVSLGDSDDLRVGEHVIAVGNPFGLGHTVTMGIVSAKARSIGAGPYDDFIQTDASINPGNSGGPLFNLRGEVVGINTAIRAGADGIGFAIPIDALKDIVDQLRNKGFVERGKLGLAFQPITPEIAKALGFDAPHGAMVTEVSPGSAAARAGIENGDVIVAVDGIPIRRSEELPRHVARHRPGSNVAIALFRRGKRLDVKATLDRLEDAEPPPRVSEPASGGEKSSALGIDLDDAPGGGARIVAMPRPQKGLMVGDVIVEVNGKTARNVAQVRALLAQLGDKGTALLRIERGGRSRYVGIDLAP